MKKKTVWILLLIGLLIVVIEAFLFVFTLNRANHLARKEPGETETKPDSPGVSEDFEEPSSPLEPSEPSREEPPEPIDEDILMPKVGILG